MRLSLTPSAPSDWSAFRDGGHACDWRLSDASGNLIAEVQGGDGTTLDMEPFTETQGDPSSALSHRVRTVDGTCTVFEDTGSERPTDFRLRLAADALYDKDLLLESWSREGGNISARVLPGLNDIRLPKMLCEHIRQRGYAALELYVRSASQALGESVALGRIAVTGLSN